MLTFLQAGYIAKWSIFFGLLFAFFAFIILGRWHAMKRINKGLKPLAYHRVSPLTPKTYTNRELSTNRSFHSGFSTVVKKPSTIPLTVSLKSTTPSSLQVNTTCIRCPLPCTTQALLLPPAINLRLVPREDIKSILRKRGLWLGRHPWKLQRRCVRMILVQATIRTDCEMESGFEWNGIWILALETAWLLSL